MKKKHQIIEYALIIFLSCTAFLPILTLIFNSFKGQKELATNPFLFPKDFILDNFPKAWKIGGYGTTVPNTLFLVICTVAFTFVFAGFAAYALSRSKDRWSNVVLGYLFVQATIPIYLFLIPLYFLWNKLGLVNSLFGLSIIYTATNFTFSIFLLRSYLIKIPVEFEEAARIDGCSELQTFFRVIMPISWPAFLTIGLIVSLNVWNEFILASIFLNDPDLYTVSISFWKFSARSGRDWGLTNAGALMMILPIIILFLIFQRKFIEGLTQGGTKG